MKTVLMADPVRYPRMTTEELRSTFLLDGLCTHGSLQLAYVDLDRAVVGHVVPATKPITLPTFPELRAGYFTERRELGVLNIGGEGAVHVGHETSCLDNLDLLYIGRGNPEIRFESKSADQPCYFLSAQLSGTRGFSRHAGEESRRHAHHDRGAGDR